MTRTTLDRYVPRIADRQVAGALAALGAVVLEGPKACGKTETARRQAASEVLLDVDRDAAQAAAIDPRLVLDGPVPRLIDEWQREPRVWDAMRRAVDDRGEAGQFILTGSATPTDEVSRHSGAGRLAVIRMRPMTLAEEGVSSGHVSLAGLLRGEPPDGARTDVELQDYVDRIVIGGWPGLLGASRKAAVQFLQGYVDTIVEHDIDVVSGARRDPRLVRRFLHAYAQVTSHPCRLSTIVRRVRGEEAEEAAGLSRWAADPYLNALRRLMIVDEVEAWDPALRSRARMMVAPKRHLVDPSLAATLLGAGPERLLGDMNTLGFLFESLVTRDLRVYAEANQASVFHYRERAGTLEVDLVVEWPDGAWIGIEVKLGDPAVDDAATSLLRLANDRIIQPPAALVVVTATAYAYQREDGVWVLPLATLGP